MQWKGERDSKCCSVNSANQSVPLLNCMLGVVPTIAQLRLGERRGETIPFSSRDLLDQLKCLAKGTFGQSPLTA